MNEPLISIIVPHYNRADLVAATIDSVRSQTLNRWECLIVDDHSTDGSFENTNALVAGDDRFKLWRRSRPTSGANACRNEGLERARADRVVFLDSDDLLHADCLEQRLADCDDATEDAVVFATELFREQPGDLGVFWNRLQDGDPLERFLAMDPPWQTTGPIWRREFLLKLGGWDEALPSYQDWDLHVRALLAGARIRLVPRADNAYRHKYSPGRTISDQATASGKQVDVVLGLFTTVVERLTASGELSESMAESCGQGFSSLARRSHRLGRRTLARRAWRTARRFQVITAAQFIEGMVLFTLPHRLGLKRYRDWLARRWPARLLNPSSPTLHKATAPA